MLSQWTGMQHLTYYRQKKIPEQRYSAAVLSSPSISFGKQRQLINNGLLLPFQPSDLPN